MLTTLLTLACLPMGQNVPDSRPVAAVEGETHLANVRQLTFGGQNAEAYWSKDGKHLVYQARVPGDKYPDEQIFSMNADGSDKRLISTGKGRCTCSYFTPNGKEIFFSSTHARNEGPQKPVDMSKGYVWAINPDYAMYRTPAKDISPRPFTPVVVKPGSYVAETTIAPNGRYMVWTSDVDGDLEIYRSDLNGGHIQRLTHEKGYDGGPFVSWDSKKVVYRRDEFSDQKQVQDYEELLREHLIRPTKLEIWVMDPDGTNKRQVTHLSCASFAPFMHPDGKRIVFSSNYGDPKGREFDIFMINVDGTGLQRITHSKDFDGFPMFTRDGKRIVFASNRYGTEPHETNIFVADWRE
ncbi:TolB family protein [Fimbriimonas ginsengisoli]|uniref:WD40 domain-containing protein n=1 Tax=Fimbriimonas ginsengisoli Gsoil 348 TaxID=661478 RepID=A0A068NNQ4_FIMGI|nr:PD40 domain-containing protein [Fimbriimonas ginsengisoli]AIE85046.1 WD40 domain-containing protein [Fimbriimonas ginsengisoli Gsoil 348]